MKKLVKLFLLCAVTAALTACGGKENPPERDGALSGSQEGGEQGGENPGQEGKEQTGEERESGQQGEESQDRDADSEAENAFSNLNEFQAVALDGSAFTQEDLADKDVTVINFWALTCGPCIAEMPDLAAIEKALPDNVQLITVCLDGSGNEEMVEYVMEETGFEGVTLLTGDGDLVALSRELQYTPTTIFTDSEGNTKKALVGGRADLAAVYAGYINDVLTELGKEEISIEIPQDEAD